MTVDILCVKNGDEYDDERVLELKKSIEQNTTCDFRFFCYTDRVVPGVSSILLKPGFVGNWNNLQVFDNEYYRMNDRKIILALNTEIIDNIDWLLSYDGDLAVSKNEGSIPSIIAFNSKQCQIIWDYFSSASISAMRRYKTVENYLKMFINDDSIEYFTNSHIDSYNKSLRTKNAIV